MATLTEPARKVVSLEDRYLLQEGMVYLTGTQAIVRLALDQRRFDLQAGLNTAGYVSGYRGSPLGGVDQAFWHVSDILRSNHIHFEAGVNEELAATALWGTQQTEFLETARYDGIFGIWYGKNPGLDRSSDALKHANNSGTAARGGVLCIVGDDHGGQSSTLCNQSEYAFMSLMIPVLAPSNVQEILDMGLFAFALSRYSGCWIGMIAETDVIEGASSVKIGARPRFIEPADYFMPDGGLNIRRGEDVIDRWGQERRLLNLRLQAAQAFARANELDRRILGHSGGKIGIITAGNSYGYVSQALADLGIDAARAEELGLTVFKVGMTWPLEPNAVTDFATGLDRIIVVEEKRPVIEDQLKAILYGAHPYPLPEITGKCDRSGITQLPAEGTLSIETVTRVLHGWLGPELGRPADRHLSLLDDIGRTVGTATKVRRLPYFCAGCPHNSSTKIPEGSRALAGIGCHLMIMGIDGVTETFSQMGGEGAAWIGQHHFTDQKHVFVNMGDGTYFHSGFLAVRAAIASGANVTYKLLFNDATGMTGGQKVEGQLSALDAASQLIAEGASKVVIVSEEPERFSRELHPSVEVEICHRDELLNVQTRLRETEGTSVLIFDQVCAAEKRRRRKRGLLDDPQKRIVINDAVCEGCGDCVRKSRCIAIDPLETSAGRKREINQWACNKDYSCLKGFCPSFVTVYGGTLRRPRIDSASLQSRLAEIPEPPTRDLAKPWRMIIAGIGGTGVVTVGALVTMAAHLDGLVCRGLDQTGLAQKGGKVVSHIQIAKLPDDIHSNRIRTGGADLVMGCDMVVTADRDVLGSVYPGSTRLIVNDQPIPVAASTINPDAPFDIEWVRRTLSDVGGTDQLDFVPATFLTQHLLGDGVAVNTLLLGYCWQKGFIPVSVDSLEFAIRLNGAAVESNLAAFRYGRLCAHDIDAVASIVRESRGTNDRGGKPTSLDELKAHGVSTLTAYQNPAYAARYRSLVDAAEDAQRKRCAGATGFAEAVAINALKLMAYKDEYEVARLYTDGTFERKLRRMFDGDYRLEFNLAPPLLDHKPTDNSKRVTQPYGAWMIHAFRLLAKLRRLRGTWFDVFGYTRHRRRERQLIAEYEKSVRHVAAGLTPSNLQIAQDIASLPQSIRGFGYIKDDSIVTTKAREVELLHRFDMSKSEGSSQQMRTGLHPVEHSGS